MCSMLLTLAKHNTNGIRNTLSYLYDSNQTWSFFKNGIGKENYLFKQKIPGVNIGRSSSSTASSKNYSDVPIYSKTDHEKFIKYFPNVVRDFTKDQNYDDVDDVMRRLETVLQYNLPKGKMLRGQSILIAYKILERPENLTEENMKLVAALSWCMETLVTAILMIDDIIDNSKTRRCDRCWYRIEGIGLTAILDAILMENGVFKIIKKYFSSHTYYNDIVDSFHQLNHKTAIGQLLDTKRIEVNEMTIDKYNLIVKYKTVDSCFLVPVTLAMFLSKTYDLETYELIKPVLTKMGYFYQVMNDICDCYADPNSSGKIGTDITEGKCTWLVVIALQKANFFQRKLIQEHYGKDDIESEKIIRGVYNELEIFEEFKNYKEKTFKEMYTMVDEMSNSKMRDVLHTLVTKLYKINFKFILN